MSDCVVGLTAGDDFISYSLSFLSAVDWLKVLVLAKCKADKSEHHQDGSGYHQPMRILHRGALPSIVCKTRQHPDQLYSASARQADLET